jgi:hypothetical protein
MTRHFKTRHLQWLRCSGYLFACIAMVGCGRQLCEVRGNLSIDGKQAPAGLKITFTPQKADAEPILAMTENDGSYLLIDRSGRRGAPPGDYRVSVGFWGDASVNPPGLSGLKISDGFHEGTSTLVCPVRPGMGPFNIAVTKQ